MLPQSVDSTFNDAELSLMAIQIMKDLQAKETLSDTDEELNLLAIEIIQDLSTKPNIDPNDSYIQHLDGIQLFNHDINTNSSNSNSDLINSHEDDEINDNNIEISIQHTHEGFQFEPELSSSSSNTNSSPSLPSSTKSSHSSNNSPPLQYTNTYNTDNTYTTTTTTDKNMVYISYPQMSPQILSSNKLVPNDSFVNDGIQVPPIPNNKFKGNKKRAVNGWIQHINQKHAWKNNLRISAKLGNIDSDISGGKLPYIPPPTLFIDKSASKTSSDFTINELSPKSISSDIESCISPRYKTPKQRSAVIPDFSNNLNIYSPNNTVASPRSTPKKIPTKKRKSKKKIVSRHPLKKVISPIFIDVNANKINFNEPIKRSKTFKKLSSATPTVTQINGRFKYKKRKGRKVRACSRPNITIDNDINEYAIETNDGFIFVDPYKI